MTTNPYPQSGSELVGDGRTRFQIPLLSLVTTTLLILITYLFFSGFLYKFYASALFLFYALTQKMWVSVVLLGVFKPCFLSRSG